ncbi:MAG: dipeptidase [Spirochaetes bacterium]|nr:dipeptidase [Spirochaetota bacterium]
MAGIRHVGIGSNFYRVGYSLPVKIRDVPMYPKLLRELLQLGYSKDDLALIFGCKLFRVWA